MAIILFDVAEGTPAGMLVSVKADLGWPTGTTQSEDIGGRRESVSRSKWRGEWDVEEEKWMSMARWIKECGLLWASLLKRS